MAKVLLTGLVAVVWSPGSPAQPIPPPTAYSATMLVTRTSGPTIYEKKVYRDGNKIMVQEFQDYPEPISASLNPTVQLRRNRVYYNLDTHKWFRADAQE